MECGILRFLHNSGMNMQAKIAERDDFIVNVPFNSRNKRIARVHYIDDKSKVRLVIKGASEIVMNQCSHEVGPNDAVIDFDSEKAMTAVETFAKDGMRTVGVAFRDFDVADWEQLAADCNNFEDGEEQGKLVSMEGLTFMGVLGLKAPVKEGVKASIEGLKHQCGTTVRLITGDNIVSAKSIAIETGILSTENADD